MIESGHDSQPTPNPNAHRRVTTPTKPGNPLTQPFWDAAAEGRLVVQQCSSCGHRQWTPQFACQVCLNEQIEWLTCSGNGVIYSASTVHRSPDPERFPPPYVVAVVALEEGPHMLTRVMGSPPSEITIGRAVRVAFRSVDGGPALYEFALV